MTDHLDNVGTPSGRPPPSGLMISVSAPEGGDERYQLVMASMVPQVTVDGVPVASGWGMWGVPVSPGRHHIAVGINHFGNSRSPAQLMVNVPPGAQLPVYYRMPRSGRGPGNIGTTPQRSPFGCGPTVVVLLAVILPLLLLAVIISVIMLV